MSRKFTRHDKFYHALSEFMDTYSSYLCNLDDNYPGIKDWNIENKTTSPNCNLHVYLLNIPSKYVAYFIDVPYQVNGVWNEPGSVYKKNKYVLDTISEQFEEYFNIYHKRDTIRSPMAYVIATEIKEENDIVTCKLHVNYDNNYPLPFPVPEKMMSFKEKNDKLIKDNLEYRMEINELESLYDELSFKYDSLKRKYTTTTKRLENNKSRTQHKIRDLYKTIDSLSNCPVCWEPIQSDKLIVPGCCHFICDDCDKKCSKCPLCRENKNHGSSS